MPEPTAVAPPRPDLPPDEPETPEARPLSMRAILWPVLLSIVVLGVIAYFTYDPAAFNAMARQANLWVFAGAIGAALGRLFFGGWRLHYVSRGRLSFASGLRGQMAWDFLSCVTPSAIGGGPLATIYVARDRGISFGEASAFFLFCMLIDQFWFILVVLGLLAASLYLDLFPASMGNVGAGAFIVALAGMLIWASFFAYAMLFRPELIERLSDRLFRLRWLRRFRERAQREMKSLRHRADVLRSQPPRFYAKGFLLTACYWLSRYSLPFFVVWSVQPYLDKLLFFLRAITMSLGALFMPTPGGSGGLEGLYVLMLGPLMPKALIAPTLLTWRFFSYYLLIALGIFLTVHHTRKAVIKRQADRGPMGDGHEGAPVPVETPHDRP